MISAFICANIYGQLLVCEVRKTILQNQPIKYEVLMTNLKWYTVNRCTVQKAVVGKPLRIVPESKWCDD